MNNVKNSIGWADFTWNPVTGCKRGCSYCYARRIHERFYKTPFSDIIMHSERLKDKMPKAPSKIFVGSMSDCKYWSHEQWDKILEVCCEYQQHTFMFLTKSESAYNGRSFPSNTMQGLTLTLNEPSARWDYEAVSYCRKPFLSIEPLMGKLTFKPRNVDLVIVGAMTGAGALKPRPEWIQSVKDNVPVNKIYWKSNIKKYL